MKSGSLQSVEPSLAIVSKIMNGSPSQFAIPLIREGVLDLVRSLSTQEGFKKAMNIKPDVDISNPKFDIEIYKVKEAIQEVKAHNPNDFQARDIYERRLLELVERDRHLALQTKMEGEETKEEEAKPKNNKVLALIG